MNIEYARIALKEAILAANEGEIPIGAVIVQNGSIIVQKHNLKEQLQCSTKHAELLAIEEASEKLGTWRLNDCDLYITMEPCMMCCGALIQARINKVYYVVDNKKFGGLINTQEFLLNNHYNHQVKVEKINNKELEEEIVALLRKFFADKR